MIGIAVDLSYLCLALSFLCGFYRLWRGPSTLDRVLAFDTISIVIIGVVVLYSIQQHSVYFLEMLLLFCLLGFTSTIAFLDYLLPKTKEEEERE